ncbi:M20/M25/M40 family metallo-hydrolase [Roseitranquillus sediminis]|uniref:M20/M25/M40 family metallo-hydrolase n=1 Tax=Roseitranquillus sediminis TaxID=2809051 RepID=UPI001D0C975D|nr:M20/M25/M40 family metallo-hydrolase [Roseitranquillus sediminis]MBM9595438.1 M20/M25/M40 family metallo-hydrolase [Roseitranquillus sediminis]
MGSRSEACARAEASIEDGTFLEDLARRVAIPTESQILSRRPELYRYVTDEIGPSFDRMGYTWRVFDNPVDERGPVLLAERQVDPSLPTALVYGHGDVVRGLEETWDEGLNPWNLTEDGDRVYGRGTVDNKGQHTVAMRAAQAVAEENGGEPRCNMKFIIETGEEQGSPGLQQVLHENREAFASDVFIGLDGPRMSFDRMDLTLGCRGGYRFDLVVDLDRSGGLHSGHWGGVLPDAGIILAHAISTLTTPQGRILVEDWLPKSVPDSVMEAAKALKVDHVEGMPEPDPEWGETSLSRAQKVFAWTSFIILAFKTGNPENPVNSVPSRAVATCQIRHTVDVPADVLMPALRRHLDERGFGGVQIVPTVEREQFAPSRTDPNDPWVRFVADSVERTTGTAPNVKPCSAGSNPSQMFIDELGTPVIWIPHSYSGCKQHGPNEHGLKSLFGEGLGVMAGVFWDLADRPAT